MALCDPCATFLLQVLFMVGVSEYPLDDKEDAGDEPYDLMTRLEGLGLCDSVRNQLWSVCRDA